MSIAVPAAGTAQSGSGADRGSSRISWVSIMFLSPTKRCQECHHSVSCQTQGDELGPKPAAPKLSPRACLRDGCVEKGGLADRDRGASLGRWTTEGGETEPGVMAQSTRGEGSDGLPLQPLWPHPNPSTRSGCLSGRVFNKQSAVGKPGPERVAGLGEGGWKRDSRPPAHRGLALLLPVWKVRVQNQRSIGLRMGRVGPPSSSPEGNPSPSVTAGRLSKDGASHSAETLPGGFRVSLPDQPAA